MNRDITSRASLARRLLLSLLAVSVPLGAFAAFRDWVLSQPLQALLVTGLYEVSLAALAFVTKVTSAVEGRWVQRATDRIDVLIRQRLSRFRGKYLEYLVFQHREFDVKGLTTRGSYTLELQQVFVDLALLPQPLHRMSADPLHNDPQFSADNDFLEKAAIQRSRHSIWELLDPRMTRDHYAIIGAPGSGKTTLLKHVALSMIGDNKRRSPTIRQKPLPVLLFLRDHSRTIKEDTTFALTDAIRSRLPRRLAVAEPPLWFEAQLARGNCVVMLDGLDEIADPQARKAVAAWVDDQISAYSRNRFIVTSRPHGYKSNPLTSVTLLEVRPFTADQVHRFVNNWYAATVARSLGKSDEGVRMDAEEGARDLLKRLKNSPALTDLAVNPLLLTMISNVHYFRSTLPGRRVELYSEIFEVFLGKRQSARGIEYDITPPQKQLVLQDLAHYLMVTNKREATAPEAGDVIAEALLRVSPSTSATKFLQMVEQSSGLLLERELGVYSFAHLTFQEYLASIYIKEHGLEGHLITQLNNSWWHETIRLYVAQSDATAIIEACLQHSSVNTLTLAVECLEEAREVQPEMRVKVDATLAEETERGDVERNRMLTKVQLALRLRRMVRAGDAYVATSFLTNAEYQLFLDEAARRNDFCQPDHWVLPSYPDGRGAEAVLGLRGTDATRFCSWLNERESSGWHYRLPMPGELRIHSSFIPADVRNQAGYWVRKDEASWEGNPQLYSQGVTIDYIRRDVVKAASRHVIDAIPNRQLLELTETRSDGARVGRFVGREWVLSEIERWTGDVPDTSSGEEGTELPVRHSLAMEVLASMLVSADIYSRPDSEWISYGGFLGERTTTNMLSKILGSVSHIDVEACARSYQMMPQFFATAIRDVGRHARGQVEGWVDKCQPWALSVIDFMPRALDRRRALFKAEEVLSLQWQLRWLALLLAYHSDFIHTIRYDARPSAIASIQSVYNSAIGLYTSLAILDRRRSGHLTASEALLLMKEPSIRL
jgi:hypothetical protein